MKTRILLLSGLLMSGMAFGQTQLINGNLENWKDTTFMNGAIPVSYSEPTGGMLMSLNKITQFPGPPPVTCFKETAGPHGGTAAARVVSGQVDFLGSPIFIPGVLGTVDPFFNSTTFGATIGVPFTDQPAKFIGWFKYLSVSGDSAQFYAATTRNVGGVRETLSVAKKTIKFSESAWTFFDVDFEQLAAGTPDSLIVLGIASAGYDFSDLTNCTGSLGSALYIDDLALVYSGGVQENLMQKASMKIFPNPASNQISVQFDGNAVQNGQIRCIDASGKLILSQAFNGTQSEINVSALANGVYSLVLMEGNNILSRQSFVKN